MNPFCQHGLGAKAEAQYGRWTPHDLRRTMRTGLSAERVRPDVAELCIGHAKRGIVAVYDQHEFETEQRAAFEAWAARLQRIVAGENADPDGEKIIRLESRA